MSINLLEQLPVSEATELSRARRWWSGILWLIFAGSHLLACLSLRWLLTADLAGPPSGNYSQFLLFLLAMAIVVSFPVNLALALVLPAFTLGVRVSGVLFALFCWLMMLWLGYWLALQFGSESDLADRVFASYSMTTLWPNELDGLNLIFSLPAILLGLTAPLLVLQGATGWQLAFPSWEIPPRSAWSIRGLMLMTFWVAAAIWMSQIQNQTTTISHSAELTWLFALVGCGLIFLLLPSITMLLKTRQYLPWYLALHGFLLIGITSCCLAFFRPTLGWRESSSIGLFLTVFLGFSVLPILLSRQGGAKLIEGSESRSTPADRFQKQI
ncbi:MAG: hypothetical protein MK108_13765 [Mariniblastus sp.]|nr:hypothetical protein [Mariniblastus sp.]